MALQHFLLLTSMHFITSLQAKNFLFGVQEGVLKCWKRQDEKAAMLLR